MMDKIIKLWEQHNTLAIGAIASTVLLVMFLLFQYSQSEILNLETRWLLVSGVPLLAALFVGGYIKSFKGFGVELEASLNKPVANLDLTATEAMDQVRGEDKRSLEYLYRLNERERKRISRLIFVQGRRDYYKPFAIEEYLNNLSGLKYIEIRDTTDKFVALFPMNKFKRISETNSNLLDDFVHSLENSQTVQHFSTDLITESITKEAELIESLKIMHSKKIQQLAVLDENKVFMGLLLAKDVEKRILDGVLKATENT